MGEPSIQQVFGAGSSQTATQLIIAKADLAAVGLTASATNTPESLYVAMLLLAAQHLTDANFASNPDQSLTIVKGFSTLVTRNTDAYRQQAYSVNLHKLDNAGVIDPDDY